jgi:two-component system nitrogen regulation response regulator NtrX
MFQSRRVLVVDDDSVVGHSINRVLTGEGYQVREAMSGSEALAALGIQPYDMVFADIRMPGMDGLDMASQIKKSHPEMPVVVITGHGTEANEKQARDLGVAGFLHKPLSPAEIIENAERVLRERDETMEAIRLSALALVSPAVTTAAEAAVAVPEPVVEARESVAKNVALFFAAPFIGLAYILAFPFVGVYAIGKYGYQAFKARK